MPCRIICIHKSYKSRAKVLRALFCKLRLSLVTRMSLILVISKKIIDFLIRGYKIVTLTRNWLNFKTLE